jgi:hypothetical protein
MIFPRARIAHHLMYRTGIVNVLMTELTANVYSKEHLRKKTFMKRATCTRYVYIFIHVATSSYHRSKSMMRANGRQIRRGSIIYTSTLGGMAYSTLLYCRRISPVRSFALSP